MQIYNTIVIINNLICILPMHEKHLADVLNDLSKLLFATTGLQQSSKDESKVVAPTHLKLVLKHCASAAADHAVENAVQKWTQRNWFFN